MPTDFLQHEGLTLHPDYAEAFTAAGLDALEALLQTAGEDNLHKPGLADWRQRLRLKLPPVGDADGPTVCYLKRYTSPPLKEQWNNRKLGHGDCAAVEWRWLTALDRLGVPGPVPVAYGARRKGLLEDASAVVTAAVPGESLERWVPTQLADDGALADRKTQRRLLIAVADLVANLHRHRFIHRDLYLAHIFLDPATLADDPPTLTLIDLQRMIRPKLRWTRWVVKDLAALNYSTPPDAASTADRIRWFRRYRNTAKLTPADRALIRAVAAKTRRIASHDAKRNTRLASQHNNAPPV
ncbi:MAG: lipopolysaccharide kinase InaA family protein [Planctomycetota bacterium]